jgi:hypothetical protein
MAMSVHQRPSFKLRRPIVSLIDQKFAQEECMRFELLRCRIVSKQVGHLIAKY